MKPLITLLTILIGIGALQADPVGARVTLQTNDHTPIILITSQKVYSGYEAEKRIIDMAPGIHQVTIIGKVKKQNGKHTKSILYQGPIQLSKGYDTKLRLQGKKLKVVSMKPLRKKPEAMVKYGYQPVALVGMEDAYIPSNSTVSDKDFDVFINKLAGLRHDLNRRKDAIKLIQENFISAAQAIQIVQVLEVEHNKLLVAKYAFGSVVDPENYGDMLCEFSHQQHEDALLEYMIQFY